MYQLITKTPREKKKIAEYEDLEKAKSEFNSYKPSSEVEKIAIYDSEKKSVLAIIIFKRK